MHMHTHTYREGGGWEEERYAKTIVSISFFSVSHMHTHVAEVKTGPIGLFLQVVGTVNKNFHLIEKQYREVILPSI